SESQERMLLILKPGSEDTARRIFEKWELDAVVIGKLTDTGRLIVKHKGQVEADIPLDPLVEKAPQYNRPFEATPKQAPVSANAYPLPSNMGLGAALEILMGSPDLCSKHWIVQQYDRHVGADTIYTGGDAAVVRLHGTNRGLAMKVDCTPRYCHADPVEGGKQAVAENWRNLTAVGAKPLAITDNMNFGNPEKPRIMGQFAGCIEGIRDACLALDTPVISGNVSFYNETKSEAILPSPVIGGVGMVEDVSKIAKMTNAQAGDRVFVIGETRGHLGQSLYLREVHGKEEGPPPPVDLAAEKRHGDFVRKLIQAGTVRTCHDVSDGGLLAALAELCLASGCGIDLSLKDESPAFWFGEDQARYVICLPAGAKLPQDVPAQEIGTLGGSEIKLGGRALVSINRLRETHARPLPAMMGQ
ncbi:MAG: phosphoribosylformylglycinamidine synthase II, partial [Proteobacteria bacterium]|nr:phosphoribosylformylglycinamidine synthase II [Pseudomonadota bacterium]